jgi:hypothetical protein
MHTKRNFDAGRTTIAEAESWRTPFIARRSGKGLQVRKSKQMPDRTPTSSTLLKRVEDIMEGALAPKTFDSYFSAIQQYREFMQMLGQNELEPTEEDVCKWVAYESLFIEPKSVAKYLQAVKYYLDSYHQSSITQSVPVKRMIRSLCMKFGKPEKDERENVTADLLLKIMKKIDMKDLTDLCCMAASIIAFLNCLRCGEFTVNKPGDRYLKKKDWKQERERGQIFLPYSKTDIFGRGHYIKYRRMKSNLDPIFWMTRYAQNNQVWTGSNQDPLFVLPNGKPLDRKTFVTWIRKMANKIGFEKADKLSGISFRRGGAQTLRDEGYRLNEIGKVGRWNTDVSAARYVTLSDEVVDEFAGVFDKVCLGSRR